MEDPTTIALNLTFLGTLAVALVMCFGLFLVFVATLVIAGLGRLAAVTVMAAGRGVFRTAGKTADTAQRDRPVRALGATQAGRPPEAVQREAVQPAKSAGPAKASKPVHAAKPEPALAPDWAAAVAQADARAAARAKAEAGPAIKVTVRELPSPTVPAQDVAEVAPLVESATDRNGQLGTVPPAFKKTPMPAAKSLLDTGSLVSLHGRPPLPRRPLEDQSSQPHDHQAPKPQSQERKAG